MAQVEDFEQYKTKADARYGIEELRHFTGNSRAAILKYFAENSIKPVGRRGLAYTYDGHQLAELNKNLKSRKGRRKPGTTKTAQTPKTSQEYEALLAQIQEDVKSLKAVTKYLAGKIKVLEESKTR